MSRSQAYQNLGISLDTPNIRLSLFRLLFLQNCGEVFIKFELEREGLKFPKLIFPYKII